MAIVLLIEDNAKLNEINCRALEAAGHTVLCALTLKEARARLSEAAPDVMLLDVMLPDGDGIAFCGEVRGETDAHILFLTGKTDHVDRVRGLTTGGDDYITKPYKLEEMLARVGSALRRREMAGTQAPAKTISRGPLTIDIVAGWAFLNGEDMQLAPKECAVLYLLAQSEGVAISAETLYREVWNQPMQGDDHSIKNTIYRLRKKLEAGRSGYVITAVRGAGYRFELE